MGIGEWILRFIKPNYFKKQLLHHRFYLPEVGPKWPWSLKRLVPCLKWIEVSCEVLFGQFGPVYLLQVSKSDDQEYCF